MAMEGMSGGYPPSVNLWIGNLSSDVTEAELKALLENFGEVDSITSYSSRNYSFVYFNRVEDAISAKEALQGRPLRGNRLKIEYAKPAKPCKSLWVAGISPGFPRDELEKIFLKFGNIQEFRFVKDGTTAYIDYVQLGDAIEALKNMNGNRFGSSQLRVDYLRSQSARRQPIGPFGAHQGDMPVSNVLLIRHPPSVIIEEVQLHYALILFGEIEKIKILSDRNCAFVEFRSPEEARRAKEGLQGKLFNDPRISIDFFASDFPDVLGLNRVFPQANNLGIFPHGIHEPDLYEHPSLIPNATFKPPPHGPEFLDLAAVHKLQNSGSQMLIGEPNWRSSPTHGIATVTKFSGAWDVHDANPHSRDSKRARIESVAPGIVENHGDSYARNLEAISSLKGSTTVGRRKHHSDGDCIWRGLIAKGGTPVCHARCVAIGEGLDADIPKVVNCSSRTGLDLLAKHYEDAIGFDIVFFLPDSEDDFASYTEFLRYLGSKDRAGVAKFDDGTTLFLVPPSNFLSKVLKVSGPERLYGVVLKFSPAVPDVVLNTQTILHSQADPRNMNKLEAGYGNFPSLERFPPFSSSRVVLDDSTTVPRAPPPVSSLVPAQPVPVTSAGSQVGLSLTPELIATLTSLLPVNNASSVRPTTSVPVAASNPVSGSEPNISHWAPEQQVQDKTNQLVQQLGVGGQFSSQFQHLQAVHASPVVSSSANQVSMPINSYNHIDERSATLPQAASSSYSHAPVNPLQIGSFPLAQNSIQSHQQGTYDALRGHVSDDRTDVQRLYNSSIVQQSAYPVGVPSQVNVSGDSQLYNPLQPDSIANQSQSNGVVQKSAETEADKNERYKSTLLFAANLLSQIHQQPSNQPGQGAG